ncbi:methyltransferase domain-containing protein [Streptomyces sp. NBC_00873]|uniref:methyltransferase domain-containing protein n=1 Tax=unclassified Streptomyces TaxID=2593676 RepID=UPI00386ADF64|nr:methyltransferase domain-containing protein [Streptomyces sp. NBC_00873]WTA44453.1 methyltransferase domain-containing protein [Streptomyces sp. NBC_00842]
MDKPRTTPPTAPVPAPLATPPTTASATPLAALLDAAERIPGAAALRRHSYELLRAGADTTVVDIGCGTGTAVAELSAHGARVIGADLDARMVAVARERLPGADIRRADAYALPFPDHSLHGYRADKVLHALADPAAALREARRVLTPGGRAVLIGPDWDTFVIDSDDPALTRTVVHARADTVPSPRAARRHRNLLLDAGFEDVVAEVRTAVLTDAAALPMLTGLAEAARDTGALTAAEASAWTADQRARARTGRLFLALPLFVAAGTAP